MYRTEEAMVAMQIAPREGLGDLVPSRRLLREPGDGEVVIEVSAAGVNRSDFSMRKPGYILAKGASDIPGLEAAGTIVAGDVGQSGFQIGDRVCALLEGGGYAQYAIARIDQCLPLPRGYSDAEAASLPEVYFTVWVNVFEIGGLRAGESLLIHGGASGVGTAAIQLAHALGHKVYATAGSDERARAVESLGATRGINYRSQDFAQIIADETNGRGVDVILDMVGGDYLPRNVNCLAEDGRLVMIAIPGGQHATLDMNAVVRRRLVITGSLLRPRSAEFKASIARSLRRTVWPLLDEKKIRSVVHATFPLARAEEAHAMLERGEQIGKIVLTNKKFQ